MCACAKSIDGSGRQTRRSIDQGEIECSRHAVIEQNLGQPKTAIVMILVQKMVDHQTILTRGKFVFGRHDGRSGKYVLKLAYGTHKRRQMTTRLQQLAYFSRDLRLFISEQKHI